MPKIDFTLAGVPDVMAALDNLTPALVNDVERLQREAAEAAAARIRSAYPFRKGNLARGVQTRRLLKGRVVAAMVVENTWWLASIYEHGVQTRRETKQGYSRGTMPAHPVFYRTMYQTRREVHQRTMDLLRQHGLTVVHAAA